MIKNKKSLAEDKPHRTLKRPFAGIYQIQCKVNKKIYVGGAYDVDKATRHHLVRLRHSKHDNRLLQADFNQYGEKSFKFSIIQRFIAKFLKDKTLTEKYNLVYGGAKSWRKKLKSTNLKTGYNVPISLNQFKNSGKSLQP